MSSNYCGTSRTTSVAHGTADDNFSCCFWPLVATYLSLKYCVLLEKDGWEEVRSASQPSCKPSQPLFSFHAQRDHFHVSNEKDKIFFSTPPQSMVRRNVILHQNPPFRLCVVSRQRSESRSSQTKNSSQKKKKKRLCQVPSVHCGASPPCRTQNTRRFVIISRRLVDSKMTRVQNTCWLTRNQHSSKIGKIKREGYQLVKKKKKIQTIKRSTEYQSKEIPRSRSYGPARPAGSFPACLKDIREFRILDNEGS